MRTEWAVLADAQRARIFVRAGGTGWQDVRSLAGSAQQGDRNGRELRLPAAMRKLAAVIGGTHERFIDRLAGELRSARKRGDFDALILVAPADVLEPLRAALDAATRRTLAATAEENLLGLPVREARRELAKRF